MKSTNRKRTLLVSGSVILLCMTVIVGMTFALFTDTQKISNHLQAGDLDITLLRTELTKTTLNTKGYLVEEVIQTTEDDPVDFSNSTNKNVFGLTTNDKDEVTEKIVPGTKYVATMQIENHSDVAFGYWVRIDYKVENEEEVKILAEQLLITVYTDKNGDGKIDTGSESEDSDESTIAKGLEVGSNNNYIGELGIGDVETFIVMVEFDDQGYTYENGVLTSTNDGAQTQSVEFDLVVYAVQATTAPTTP